MWQLIIPLVLGNPSEPTARRDFIMSAETQSACHELRQRLVADVRWDTPTVAWTYPTGEQFIAGSLNADTDQPPGVEIQWRYANPREVGYCAPAD